METKDFQANQSAPIDSQRLFIFVSACIFLVALYLLPHYGIVGDTPKNFEEGQINLNYLLRGQAPVGRQLFALAFQIHGSFFFMCTVLSQWLFHNTLHWLDRVSALHILLPVSIFCFMNIFFNFLQKKATTATAWIACLTLWFYPRFWGTSFNNIKDIPLFIFIGLTIFALYRWTDSRFRENRQLYMAAVFLGLGLSNKVYAILAPGIIFFWWIWLWFADRSTAVNNRYLPPLSDIWDRGAFVKRILICAAICAAIIAVFFMPAFYSVQDKAGFLSAKSHVVKGNLFSVFSIGWNVYPWVQIFATTPVLSLFAGILGLITAVTELKSKPLHRLMLIWFFLLPLIFCTPFTVVYGGVRLFLSFLIPFAYFSAIGIVRLAQLVFKILPIAPTKRVIILASVMLSLQVAALAEMHPYESMFFNRLVGGLKGAQQKKIPDAGDYWQTSYLESSRILNSNLPKGSFLFTADIAGEQTLRYYGLRPDIRLSSVKQLPLPRRSFLLLLHSDFNSKKDYGGVYHYEVDKEAEKTATIQQVNRQGGKIFSIHFKP